MSKNTLTITDNRTGKNYELPITDGTIRTVDLRQIKAGDEDFGLMGYDPAYLNTASCRSAITLIDGDKGILRYRGYPIEQLAETSSYLEVAYLLFHGELPDQTQLANWIEQITTHTFVHENVKTVIEGFRYDAHPMGMFLATIGALSTFYPEAKHVYDKKIRMLNVVRLLAKVPTIAAWSYRHSQGFPFVYPDNQLSFAGNFLAMMKRMSEPRYKPNPILERALDVLFILHADHEQNCSTSTVRLVGSSQANLFASVAAGILALWGPLHGGANQEVVEMLQQINADGGDVSKFVKLAKDKNSGFRLMGFGHRVYKNGDHRAPILNALGREIAKKKGADFLKWFQIGDIVEKIMLRDKNIHPNVDFPCGMTYFVMGIPVPQYTPIFVAARMSGWCAHVIEQHANNRIIRPLSLYTGAPVRKWNG